MKILYILLLFFAGCADNIIKTNRSLIEEKRVQNTRKSEVIINSRARIVSIVTHLNNVKPKEYKDKECFFVEIFSEDKTIFKKMHFLLMGNVKPLSIEEIKPKSFDDVFYLHSKWNRGFLVCFEKVGVTQRDNVKLSMYVDGYGEMLFDFSYNSGLIL